jgi:hypothetical protein
VVTKNRLFRVLAASISLALALAGSLSSPVSAVDTSGVQISKVGERAFKDLSTCLASGKNQALDVFYLVDSSGSLSYTDRKEVRKTVLENIDRSIGLDTILKLNANSKFSLLC